MDDKKKVAIIVHGLGTAGNDVLFSRLGRCLDTDKLEITYLLATDPDNKQLFEKDVTDSGISVVHLHDLKRMQKLIWPFTMFHAFRTYGPFDVVHANMNLQNGLILKVAHAAAIPVLISHAHTVSHVKDNNSIFRNIYKNVMRKWIHRYSTVRLACSKESGEYYYRTDSFSVLYNGIDLNRFISNPGISLGGYRCITTGRLYPDKNPLFLLDVFEQIHLFKPEAELTWIGTGRMKNELEDLIRKKNLDNSVHLIGEQKHPESFLKEADIFLFPSLFEAFGMALVEAQAAGLECYASDRIPRIVDCGKCCFLSLDLSAKEWAERIIADTDTGNKMKLDEDKLRQFDIHSMARKLSKIYLTGSVNNMSQDG